MGSPDDVGGPPDDTGMNLPTDPGLDGRGTDPPVDEIEDVKDPRGFRDPKDLTLEERLVQLELITEWLWDDYEQRRLAAGSVDPPDPLRDGIDRWLKRVNARRRRKVPDGG